MLGAHALFQARTADCLPRTGREVVTSARPDRNRLDTSERALSKPAPELILVGVSGPETEELLVEQSVSNRRCTRSSVAIVPYHGCWRGCEVEVLAAVVHGWVGEDILDEYTTERHPFAARLLQNARVQIA